MVLPQLHLITAVAGKLGTYAEEPAPLFRDESQERMPGKAKEGRDGNEKGVQSTFCTNVAQKWW